MVRKKPLYLKKLGEDNFSIRFLNVNLPRAIQREHNVYPKYIGALIVYDITDLESWSKVSKWMKELQMYLPQETPIIITGNKCDIPNRQIPIDEAEK